jgi:hypothetical protein
LVVGQWVYRHTDRRRFSTGYPAEPQYRDAAERKVSEIKQRLAQPESDLVTDIMEAYLVDLEARAVDKDRPRRTWAHTKPFFGALVPGDIGRTTRRDYTDFRRRKNISYTTINKELSYLRAGLRWDDKNF